MGIENLRLVHWAFEGFVTRITAQRKRQDKIYDLCAEIESREDFANICHRAAQEVEDLKLNKQTDVLHKYFQLFSNNQTALDNWERDILEDKFKMNQINNALSPIRSVQHEIGGNRVIERHENKVNVQQTIEPNDMFVISPYKFNLRDKGTGRTHKMMKNEPINFDLQNDNIYDAETGELLELADLSKAKTEFLHRLSDMYALDVKPFLTHHYTKGGAPAEFYEYVKYAALHSNYIIHEGIIEAIRDWLEENKVVSSENISAKNLTIAQIALVNIYKGKSITRDNANEIANSYGYTSKNSGESLYQKYLKYRRTQDRIADDGSKRKSNAKLKLILSVVEHLQTNLQNGVISEAEQLKKTIETNY